MRQLVAVSAAAVFSYPLAVMVSGSLRTPAPLGAYRQLPQLIPLATYLWNSVAVATVAVPATILVASWAGFGIRLLPATPRRLTVVGCLAVMLVPVTAVWATRFQVYRAGGIVGGLLPLVAPALLATSPFFVLVYVWTFARLPATQLEAARLEGASAWAIWRRLAMP